MSLRFRWLIGLVIASCVLGVGCAEAPGEDVDSNAGAATDTTPAKTAVADLADATEKKEAVDARLGRALGHAGSFLTPKQQADFVRAFNDLPDVKAAQQGYRAKSQNLAVQLDKIKDDPEAIATYGAKNLVAGYELVAKTPDALSALVFGTDVLAKRVAVPGLRDADVLERIIAPSLAGAYLSRLMESGDVATATERTIGILESGTNVTMTIAGWLQKYNAFRDTDVLAKSLGITSESTVSALRTVAGIIAIWKVGDDLAQGEATQLIQDFFAGAPTAATAVASATALFRHVVLGIDHTPLADEVIRWSGRLATGIGIVMGALALWNDAGKWNESADAKVRVLSDVLGLGAGILVLAGTGPVGPVLATVALGLTFFADWLENRRLAAQEQADLTACLPKAGLSDALATSFLASEPALVRDLVENVKLAPEDLQWLMTVDPTVARTDAGPPPLQFIGIRVTQKIFDLDPNETAALLHAALGRETRAEEGAVEIDAFFRALTFGGLRGDMTREEALEWLDTHAVSPSMPEPRKSLLTSAVAGARSYLATVD
jgi:hypothetical protein